jgi:hypothetical protein
MPPLQPPGRPSELESGRNALLERYTAMVPEALDGLTGEERRILYRMMRLQVVSTPEGTRPQGFFAQLNLPG